MLLVLVVGALALHLRRKGLDRGLWLDEHFTLQACCLTYGREWVRRMVEQMVPFHAALAAWSLVTTDVAMLRWVPVAFSVGTIGLAMLAVGRHARAAAVLAGGVLASMPLVLRYALELRGYGLLLTVTAAVLVIASRATMLIERRSRLLLAVLLAVAVSLHPTALLLLPAVVVLAVVAGHARATDGRAWAAVLGIPLVASLMLVVGQALLLERSLSTWWMPAPSIHVLAGVAGVVGGVDEFRQPLSGWVATVGTIGSAVLVALLLWRERPGGTPRLGVAFQAAAATYLVGLLAGSLALPMFWPRTALVAVVPATCGLALLVAQARSGAVRVVGGLVVVWLCAGWATHWMREGAVRDVEPWRQVMQTVNAAALPGDVVLVYPSYTAGLTQFYASDRIAHDVRPVAIGADASALADAVRPASAAMDTRPRTTFLVVRADFTTRDDAQTFDALLHAARQASVGGSVRLLLVVSSDVQVDPRPAETAATMLARASELLGAAGRRQVLTPDATDVVFSAPSNRQ